MNTYCGQSTSSPLTGKSTTAHTDLHLLSKVKISLKYQNVYLSLIHKFDYLQPQFKLEDNLTLSIALQKDF